MFVQHFSQLFSLTFAVIVLVLLKHGIFITFPKNFNHHFCDTMQCCSICHYFCCHVSSNVCYLQQNLYSNSTV